METNVSRRDFLKGSIVVALGAAGAATLSSCAGGDAAAKADSAVATAPDTAAKTATLHRGYGAAHGDKCFTSVVVATAQDGTILAASVDDYQFMPADSAGITPVPNSDAGFADGYAEGKVLMSKTVNNDAYSASMKEKAQSTTPWLTSMKAIEAYCVGKKASDLTKTSLDAVTGATLVDAPNYLKLVSEVAGSDDITTTGAYAGDGSDLKMGRATAAAHGDKAFAEAVSLVQGDVLVASSIDEFQFADASSAGLVPVPNSDAAFAEGYAEQGAHVQVGELRYVQRQHEGKGPVHYAVDRIHVGYRVLCGRTEDRRREGEGPGRGFGRHARRYRRLRRHRRCGC